MNSESGSKQRSRENISKLPPEEILPPEENSDERSNKVPDLQSSLDSTNNTFSAEKLHAHELMSINQKRKLNSSLCLFTPTSCTERFLLLLYVVA